MSEGVAVNGDAGGPVDPGWSDVIGQGQAVAFLRSTLAQPVHAYLFIGPSGSGKRAAARAFAGDLLAAGTTGEQAERHHRLAVSETHPDLLIVEREGPFISAEQARYIAERSALAPVEGDRKVLILDEFHLVRDAGPILLKAIEEPPAGTIFLVLADEIPPELVTIASRCVRVDFAPISDDAITERLVGEGVDIVRAAAVAAAAGGNLGRARLLATDEGLDARISTWQSVPERLDSSGHMVATLVDELIATLDEAEAPVLAGQQAELDALAAREEQYGERGSGRKALDDRHKRAKRRLRMDELRFGLSMLARTYRDGLVTNPEVSMARLDAVQRSAESLERNPNERLLLESLLIRLGT